MPIPLRLLIVERSENDARLLVQLIGKAGYEVVSRRVETRDAMAAALAQDTWDTVIADHNAPAFDAFGALETLQASGQDIPFIVLCDSIGEEAAVALMKAGAADYVMKDGLDRLTAALVHGLREAATRRERRQALDALTASEAKYRQLYDLASDALFLIERETGRILEANAGATAMYGYSHEEWLTMRNVDVSVEPASTTAATLTGVTDIPVRWHRKKNGAVFPVDVKATHFEWQGRAVHLAAIRDATERVGAQEALRAERDRAESYLQVAGMVMVALDLQGKITLINRRGCEVLGYTESELLGRDWFEVCLPPAARDAMRAVFDRLLTGGDPGLDEFENPVVTKSGEIRLMSWRNSMLHNARGSLLGLLSSGEDITERRRAEDALREHERLMADAQAIAHFGSWSIDFNTGKVTWSKEMFQLYGLSTETDQPPTRLQFAELLHPDDRSTESAWSSQWRSGKPLPNLEFRTRPIHGAVRWLSNHGLLQRDAKGDPWRFIGTVLDITDRKQAQAALRESEERHLTILQTAMDGFWQVDTEGRLLEVNETYCRMSGYTEQELLSMRIADLEAIESPGDTTARINKILAQGEARFESRHRRKDGTVFDVEISAQNRPAEGGRLVIFVRDITARKHADEALRESQEKYRLLIETATESIIVVEDGLVKFVNPITLVMLGGYSENELIDRTFAELIHPDDRSLVLDNYRRRIAHEPHRDRYAFRLLARGGSVKWVEINATVIEWQGKPATLDFLTDITARKQAEETLREREEFLTNLLELAPVSIYVTGADGRMRMVNRRWEEDTARQRSETLGRPLDQVFPPETARRLAAENQRVIDQGVSIAFEQVIESPVEPHSFYTVKFPLRDALGQIDAVGGLSVDITARKQAEETLRQSEASLREAQEIARIGRWEMDLATGRISWSDGVFALFEISGETSVANYEAGLELIHPDDRAMVAQSYRESVDDKQPYEIEHRLLMPGCRVKWVSVIGRTEYDESGQPIRSVGTVQDITARKQSEETLRLEQERLDLAVNATGLGLYDWNPKTGDVLFSERWAAMFGYRLDELPDHPQAWSERVHPDDLPLVRKATQAAFRDGAPLRCEYRMRHRDGSWRWILDQGRIVARDANGEVIRFVGADLDITERKQAEQELQMSQQRLSLHVEKTPLAVIEFDLDGRVRQWNPAAVAMFGFSREEAIGQPWTFIVPAAIHGQLQGVWAAIVGQRGGNRSTNENVTKDGRAISCEWFNTPLVGPDGQSIGVASLIQDVTERKTVEEQLRRSEEDLRQAQQVAHVGSWRWEIKADRLNWSDEMYRIFGITKEGFSGSLADVIARAIHPDDRAKVEAANLSVSQQGKAIPLEYRVVWPDGTVRVVWAEAGELTRDEEGNPAALTGIVLDTTDRNRAEEARRESDALLQRTWAGLDEAVVVVNLDTRRILMCSPAVEQVFGYRPEELVGGTMRRLHVSDESFEAYTPKRLAATGSDGVSHLEYQRRRKDGAVFWSENTVATLSGESGGPTLVVNVVRDITERKRAEEALRESEVHYHSLFDSMLNGYAYCRMLFVDGRPDDFVYLTVNPAFETLTGLKDVVGKKVSEVIPGIRETDQELLQAYGRVSLTGIPERLEIYVESLSMWFSISVYSPKKEHFVAVFDVITERKRAEEALRESEARLRDITFSMADWVWEVDKNGAYTYSSQKGSEFFGPPRENILGKTPFDLMPPDEAQRVAAIFSGIAANKAPIKDLENWNVTKSGERICLLTNGVPILDQEGNLKGYRGVDKDITERKRAEQQLAQSHELLANLARLVPGVVYQYRLYPDGRSSFPYASPGMNDIYEVTPEEVREDATPVFGRLHPDDYARVAEAIQVSARTLQTFYCEFRVVLPRQGLRWRWSQAQPERMADGGTLWHGVISDVTERKQAEEALQQTERDLVNAQKLAGVGSWTYDPATQQPKWSEGMFRVWGLDPKLGAPSYADHRKYIHPDDYKRFDDAVGEAVQHGISYQFDLRICRPDGTSRTITTICEPQLDANGSVVSLRGTVQDITERKQAEDAIRASLREKELLLREIHHRVKNNLQIIASLLTLQAETVRDPAALEVFMDSQNRIRAMSLIHAKLYQSTDLATVDFGAFVRDLGTILLRAYAVNPSAIRLQVGAGRADLAIDTVIPCSLIVNELLTNAIKYAFPSGAGGTIAVDLSQQEAEYTLRVADNGVGFPDSVDFRKTESLGLRLVILLVAQLDGTIELNKENGSEFIIRFPTRASV